MDQTSDFLHALWDGKPEDLYMLFWSGVNKKSQWIKDIDQAARWAKNLKDLYTGVGLSKTDYGATRRCVSENVVAIPGLWADIDYHDGDAHKGKNLPPSEEAAFQLLDSLGPEPTLVIHSGHGLQAYWLFKEPMLFETDRDRALAAAMSREWHRAIVMRAKEHGWSVDSVHDLARILRVPGTTNNKIPSAPALVRIVKSDGPRYVELSDFDEYIPEVSVEEVERSLRSGTTVSTGGSADARGMDYWRETLSGVGEGERDNRMTSLHGKLLQMLNDQALDSDDCRGLVLELALLVNQNFNPPLTTEEVKRSFVSIYKSEKTRRMVAEAEQIVQCRMDVDAGLGDLAARDQQMELLAKLLTPDKFPLKKILKMGATDPTYKFVLEDDTECEVCSVIDQGACRKAIFDWSAGRQSPAILRKFKQDEWEQKVCRRIAQVAEEVYIPEFTLKSKIAGLLADYLSSYDKLNDDASWKDSISTKEPFTRGGELFIATPGAMKWLRDHGYNVSDKHLVTGFVELGFKRDVIKATRGTASYRYWRIAVDQVPKDIQWAISREPEKDGEAA